MIEGGGLGEVDPDEVGPIAMQAPNGVVDLVVADEAEAVAVAKQPARLLPGRRSPTGAAPDQARAARRSCPSASAAPTTSRR